MERHPIAVISAILTAALALAASVVWGQLDDIRVVQKEIQRAQTEIIIKLDEVQSDMDLAANRDLVVIKTLLEKQSELP